MRLLALVAITIACGSHPPHAPSGTAHDNSALEVSLYRDHAVISHRIQVAIPTAATATVHLRIAAGVEPDDIYIVEKSDLVVREIRKATDGRPSPKSDGCDEVSCVLDDYEPVCCARFKRKKSQWGDDEDGERPAPPSTKSAAPMDVDLVISGPHAGNYTLVVGYDTERIVWDAGYTMTTLPTHDRVQLRGAISIRNATGLVLHDANVRVIDALHKSPRTPEPDPNGTPTATPRELGRLDLVEGDTRVELLADPAPRPLRSVLVYDPIGTGFDYAHATPVQDPNLGIVPPPTTRVAESFELDRVTATQHLPAGPVRLLERKVDGSLSMLGESKLFGPATLSAVVDSVAVGTAEHVTAKRERRDLTIDNDRKRVVEEIAITIDNTRDQAVEVVLREHLYRGENWAIAYWSVPDITKEGKQQIAMRVKVPAKHQQTVLYVVVYSWGT